jgi:hypothetical protein
LSHKALPRTRWQNISTFEAANEGFSPTPDFGLAIAFASGHRLMTGELRGLEVKSADLRDRPLLPVIFSLRLLVDIT